MPRYVDSMLELRTSVYTKIELATLGEEVTVAQEPRGSFFFSGGMKKSRQYNKQKVKNKRNTTNLRGWISIHTDCSTREHLWTTKGQIHRTRASAKELKEDKMAPPIHTEHFHTDGHFDRATTMISVVNNAVNSFVMRSTISWNKVAPLDNTT